MRILIALLFAFAFAAAGVQAQDKMRSVGILSPTAANDPQALQQLKIFTDRLRELGYVEGKTLKLEKRFADGDFERLPVLAGELVKAGVEVIVTAGTPGTTAAKRATATIPIVAASVGDPVVSGFARSLEKPGFNITGFATMGSQVYEHRLALLIEAVPGAKRIGFIAHPSNDFFARILPGLQAAAQKVNRDIMMVGVKDAKTLEEGFGKLATAKAGAVIIADDGYISSQTGAIVRLAEKYKLPTLFPTMLGAEQGGLLAYANDQKYRYQSTAVYVDRILKGAKPADMPIEQPVKFDLAVNQKTAAALGIVVPPAVVARATKVIQ